MANIIQVNFPADQYVKEKTKKTQIVLHHTASGNGVQGDINYWKSTKERVATHFIIDRDGMIWQLFSEDYWAYHLGLKQADFSKFKLPYIQLDKSSIAIELDSWGYLTKGANNTFYPWAGTKNPIPKENVKEYCSQNLWRGKKYYEKYTFAQLEALKDLLRELCYRHNIPKTYRHDMWGLPNALKGIPGIWTHASFRTDKSDCHPQNELINMLKLL